ncbi:MAG: ATP-dependent helicase HrpB [Jatrophihabitans sp.]
MLPDASTPGANLPVQAVLAQVSDAVRARGVAVVVAPPGSGKTSLLPLALADATTGTVIVAEPRRMATRAAANRLASLLGEPVGGRIGYAMRGERVGGADVRVEVVTTGLLVRRLQREPDLPGVGAVIIDECHERHLDADLALAFCVDVRTNLREDLALIATSATPDTVAMTRALATGGDEVPVLTAEAALFDIEVVWAPPPQPTPLLPGARVDPRLLGHVADVTRRALAEGEGDVLVFVPGEAEIATVTRKLQGVGVAVLPLFGRQSRSEQDRALAPSPIRRVIVTTSVAESSLTVPGVRAVVDAGLSREPRTDHARGLGTLVTVRVSKAAATQRAGRSGREGSGRVYRCWSELDHVHLDAHAAPEIRTADLAGFALDVAAWGAPGGNGLALLDAPPAPALDAATGLLRDLGALGTDGRITERGRALAAVGAHPRLARAVLDGASLVGAARAREIVALLSDDRPGGRTDDLTAHWRALRTGQDRVATARWRDEVRRLGRGGTPATALSDDLAVGAVVGLAFPERLARARGADASSYLMAGGTGAALDQASALRGSTWLAIAVADRPVGRADARIRSAVPIDEATALSVAGPLLRGVEEIRWSGDGLVARRVTALGAIELSESVLAEPDPLAVAAAVRDGLSRSGLSVLHWSPVAKELRERLAFCHAWLGAPWPAVDDDALLADLDRWLGPDLLRVRRPRDLDRIDLLAALRRLLPWPSAGRFDELAPERLSVPSGSRVRVRYDGAEPPVIAVKLQETFGWTSTPTLADGRAPVVAHLLSPAGRTVAITADLASFWVQGYPQVRSDLRARYPRHPWPEDPLAAVATARATSRRHR